MRIYLRMLAAFATWPTLPASEGKFSIAARLNISFHLVRTARQLKRLTRIIRARKNGRREFPRFATAQDPNSDQVRIVLLNGSVVNM